MSPGTEYRKLAAIMFTDMVGYSALSQRNEALALELLEEHRHLLRELFPRFNGTEIKTIGDAFLAEFHSALEAVQCAIEIQRTLARRNTDAPGDRQIQVRIGVHIGDVMHRGGDVYGDGVNIASRIEALAGAGGICVSMDVERQIRSALETRLVKLGPMELKNISVPMELFRVVLPWDMAAAEARSKPPPEQAKPFAPGVKVALMVGVALVVALGAGYAIWLRHKQVEAASTPPGAKPVAAPARSDALDRHRVAVMPLANFSPDAKDDYFADGMTEELISSLSKVRGLAVIARTSVMRYKTGTASVAEVGRDLLVGTVLEGSVRKMGDQLRITVLLIDVASQAHLWATNYDREFKDVFAIQSDVAQRVAGALQVQLLGVEQQRLAKAPTSNLEAYRLYLLGRAHFVKATREDAQRAVEFFNQAIELDPQYALAYAGLADVYRIGLLGLPKDVALQKQREFARRGLELDDTLAETLIQDAYVKIMLDWDWAGAERQFQRATNANPNYVFAHDEYATFLFFAGRSDEALDEERKALELDPASPILYVDFAWIHFASGRYDEAIAAARKALDLDPSLPPAYALLGFCLTEQGKYADALAMFEKARPLQDHLHAGFGIGYANAKAGKQAEARQALVSLEELERKGLTTKVTLAALHLALGQREQALDLLEQAAASRDPGCLWLKVTPEFRSIRADPRFQAVLKKVGFPE